MKKFLLPFILMFILVLSLVSCKSVGGYYIRHGTGYVLDTLHYRITMPNSSNVNLINY